MKSTPDILNSLNKKIEEHKKEIQGCDFSMKDLRKDPNLDSVMKIMTLKDKILFHKGAIAVLEGLVKDIEV